MDLKELESGVDPQTHWYYQTKKIRLLKFFEEKVVRLGRKVTLIDVGAGSGFFSLELYGRYPNNVEQVLLVDLYYSDEEVTHNQDITVQKMREFPSKIKNSFIIMMDVLEHIEDDGDFLQQIITNIFDRSYFFITVPAFQELWSGHDVYLGHYRRYTLKQLASLLKIHNFSIRSIYYQYGLIFPLVYIIRKLENRSNSAKNNMKPVNPLVNGILQSVLRLEMLVTRFNKWFGLTCTAEGYIDEIETQ